MFAKRNLFPLHQIVGYTIVTQFFKSCHAALLHHLRACLCRLFQLCSAEKCGEIARSQRLVERLRRRVEFIAPVEVVPGAVEMDALVAGALRMLRGQEEIRDYDTERND